MSLQTDQTLPVRIVNSGWWEIAPAAPTANVLNGSLQFDAVIVGGGFTGLACARRLSELRPDARIAVIEADRIGRTLSGRNSGYLIDLSFYSKLNRKSQNHLTRLQTMALDHLRDLVHTHAIDCDWNEGGYLRAALSDVELKALKSMQERYEAIGVTPQILSADEVNKIMGTTAYRAGLRHGRTTLVNPSKLVRALATILPENVTIFELSKVSGISTQSGGHDLSLENGSVRCSTLYLCCNAGLPALGYARSRQVEIATFAAVTPVLDTSHGAIGTVPEFGYLPSIQGAPTIRKTPDNRLMLREHLAFTPGRAANQNEYDRFLETARDSMRIRWPQLSDLRFDMAWHGVMPMTRNGARVFGQYGPGVFATAFCNGSGNTAGTAAGMALAELGCGSDTQMVQDSLALPQADRVPPNWLLKPFVKREIASSEKACRNAYGALLKK